uniref:ABC transmembrane type-1 domain-containing protein n=1 Tax=Panagrolaimus sp. ES5 TaxID=591445 RepID=A0AC34F3N8_9BILA
MSAVFSKLAITGPQIRKLTPTLFGVGAFLIVINAYRRRHGLGRLRSNVPYSKKQEKNGKKAAEKSHVDIKFIKKLIRISKILIPSFFSTEVFYMILIAVTLLCRTYADVWMIMTSTGIEAAIIDRNKNLFRDSVFHYLLCMPTVSVVNALLKFSLSELKLRFRERLTNHLYSQYLDGFTFYKMSNLDNRIANADQLLTQDVDRFCEGIVELYSNLSKPLVDVALYCYKLGGALGFQAPSRLFFYLLISGVFLTYLRRPIGRLTVVEQQLEGEFRFVNSRLIMNSEEIAFYQGNEREKQSVMTAFQRMISHLRSVILFRFGIGFCDNIIAKYAATVVGWYTVSRPFFNKSNTNMMAKSKNELIQDYYNSGRMMFKLAEALGRLALAGREMTRLSGFTTRVDTLMEVLKDLQTGKYERTMVADGALAAASSKLLSPGAGELIIRDNIIKFEDVPLVTPNGDVLIPSMSFEVPSGRNRPYMTLGTLRDQVIYPDKPSDMRKKGITDRDLIEFLERVQLEYILQREGGWDSVQDWMDVLSGGEKQRIAMARLFYHRPQFAILDECTSAVSMDVEGTMYKKCRELGITLFTVSHRKSLWVHHDYYLKMDGQGAYQYEKIDDNVEEFGS